MRYLEITTPNGASLTALADNAVLRIVKQERTYSLQHRLRLLLGVNGRQHDGSWCYSLYVPALNLPFRYERAFFTFMHQYGNPTLNFLIGYKKL